MIIKEIPKGMTLVHGLRASAAILRQFWTELLHLTLNPCIEERY